MSLSEDIDIEARLRVRLHEALRQLDPRAAMSDSHVGGWPNRIDESIRRAL